MASPAGPRQPAPLPRSRASALLLAGGLILAGVLAALAVGRYPVAPADLVRAMWAARVSALMPAAANIPRQFSKTSGMPAETSVGTLMWLTGSAAEMASARRLPVAI